MAGSLVVYFQFRRMISLSNGTQNRRVRFNIFLMKTGRESDNDKENTRTVFAYKNKIVGQ